MVVEFYQTHQIQQQNPIQIHTHKGGRGAPFLFGMGASKNTVWGMAAYDLRGMEDGNFSRFKYRIAMENEGIPLSQTAFPKGW